MKLSVVSKKIILIFFGILITPLFLELLCRINSYLEFIPTPIVFHSSAGTQAPSTPHPLEEKAKRFLSSSPFSHWKHLVDIPAHFERARKKKTKSSPHEMFKPHSSFQSRLDYPGLKSSIYNAVYSFDKYGFRKTPGSATEGASKRILFLGCSFTFGDGLNDTETFSHFFAQMNPGTDVLNSGGSGDGPHSALFGLSDPRSRFSRFKDRIDTAVYTALPDHIDRATCSYNNCIRNIQFSPSDLFGPMYVLNRKNELEYKGIFIDHFPWNQGWLKYINKSDFVKTFNLFSSGPSEEDYQLTVAIFKEMKTKLMRQWGVRRFVVALYPLNSDYLVANTLQKRLEESGIETFNFNNLNAQSTEYDLFYKMDGHPTPAGAYLYAWLLSESLKSKP